MLSVDIEFLLELQGHIKKIIFDIEYIKLINILELLRSKNFYDFNAFIEQHIFLFDYIFIRLGLKQAFKYLKCLLFRKNLDHLLLSFVFIINSLIN